jgi:effector-binding domain-containing protein
MKKRILPLTVGIWPLLFILITSLAASQETKEGTQVTLTQVSPFFYCSLMQKGGLEGIPEAIKSAWDLLQSQNITPTGPALGVFYESRGKSESESILWEIGFPVTPQAEVLAPLALKEWKHAQVAEAFHIGPLTAASQTYERILAWMQDNGYVQSGPVLEMYYIGSVSTPPAEYKTRILVPCVPKH